MHAIKIALDGIAASALYGGALYSIAQESKKIEVKSRYGFAKKLIAQKPTDVAILVGTTFGLLAWWVGIY